MSDKPPGAEKKIVAGIFDILLGRPSTSASHNKPPHNREITIRKPQLLLAALLFFGSVSSLLAQGNNDANQAAAGAAGCAACGGGFLFVIVTVIALNIALLVWVSRDAKSRGMDSPVIWMILVMVTGLIGLVIYIFSRPQGNLIQCTRSDK